MELILFEDLVINIHTCRIDDGITILDILEIPK
jgi:hypothetical protein